MFSSKFVKEIENLDELSDQSSGIERLVNLRDDYESNSWKEEKKSSVS